MSTLKARDLSNDQLIDVVERIQAILWLEQGEQDEEWNPDKEWDVETIEKVAHVMDEHGLRPDKCDDLEAGAPTRRRSHET